MNVQTIALKASLAKQGYAQIVLTGTCMRPLLRNKDKARISIFSHLSIGEIYLLSDENNQLLAHRLIRLRDNKAIFKGDCSNIAECVNVSKVIGLVTAIQFAGTATWVNIENNKKQKRITAYLSGKMIHTPKQPKTHFMTKAQRLYRRAFREMVALIDRHQRRRWGQRVSNE